MSSKKMHTNELNITPKLIKNMLLQQFPSWSHLPLQVIKPQGTDNAIYKLGEDKLVRLARTKESSFSIEKEGIWLPKLGSKLPLPIPKVLGKGKASALYPFSWLICSWLDGICPYKNTMTEEQAVIDLGLFIKTMQKIPVNTAPKSPRGIPLNAFDQQVQLSIPLMKDLYDTDLLQSLWLSSINIPQWTKDPVWIHGDLHAGNLLVKDQKLVGIIDFGLAGIGDPACDMMAAWTFCNKKTREKFHSTVNPDKNTWNRGRGWALFLGIMAYPYYRFTNPLFANIAKKALDEALSDSTDK